jgi:uncharacterized protein (UPF0332 family)
MPESAAFLELADEALEDYRKGMEAGLSVRMLYNRIYYACFYASKAALTSIGEEPKTHRGTANLVFQILYGERGLVAKETAAFLSTIQRKRDEADYETGFDDSREDVEAIFDEAQQFIETMKTVVEE